jgi:hypothetical protein
MRNAPLQEGRLELTSRGSGATIGPGHQTGPIGSDEVWRHDHGHKSYRQPRPTGVIGRPLPRVGTGGSLD